MRKYFYSFLLLLLVIITSIAYLGNINRNQLIDLTIEQISNQQEQSTKKQEKQPCEEAKKKVESKSFNYDFIKAYPELRKCNLDVSYLKNYEDDLNDEMTKYDYSQPASNRTHNIRILKGILVYFPIELHKDYMYEFRWLYRSWIEMQKSEPPKWRTDLIVFVKNDKKTFEDKKLFFNELNCSFSHRRLSNKDKPMCTLIAYEPIKSRNIEKPTVSFENNRDKYEFMLKNVKIFDDDEKNLNPFYNLVKEELSNYGYVDSILMAFDGYKYLKSAGYNFLIRSDMDVFFTPLFGEWLPRHCNDFYVGRGGYSSQFNVNRLGRIAKDIGLEYASEINLGSTWYSTPDQFRLVSYLTLFGMSYVSEEEFSQPERDGKLGVLLWPYWHYGVLLLYGQNLMMNHLIETKQLNIIKLQDYLDFPSHNTMDVNKIIHIHVFHGDDMFSKFQFKAGKYDQMSSNVENPNLVKFYSLKLALEGKRLSCNELNHLLKIEAEKKI